MGPGRSPASGGTSAGEFLFAVNCDDDDWWEGIVVGEQRLGRFPAAYVSVVADVTLDAADDAAGVRRALAERSGESSAASAGSASDVGADVGGVTRKKSKRAEAAAFTVALAVDGTERQFEEARADAVARGWKAKLCKRPERARAAYSSTQLTSLPRESSSEAASDSVAQKSSAADALKKGNKEFLTKELSEKSLAKEAETGDGKGSEKSDGGGGHKHKVASPRKLVSPRSKGHSSSSVGHSSRRRHGRRRKKSERRAGESDDGSADGEYDGESGDDSDGSAEIEIKTIREPSVVAQEASSSASTTSVAAAAVATVDTSSMDSSTKDVIEQLQRESQELVTALGEREAEIKALKGQVGALEKKIDDLQAQVAMEQSRVAAAEAHAAESASAASAAIEQRATLEARLKQAELALEGQAERAEQLFERYMITEQAARSELETGALAQASLIDTIERRHYELLDKELNARQREQDAGARERQAIEREKAVQRREEEVAKLAQELADERAKLEAAKSSTGQTAATPAVKSAESTGSSAAPPLPRSQPPPLLSAHRSPPRSPRVSAAQETTIQSRERSQSQQDRVQQLRIIERIASSKVKRLSTSSSDQPAFGEAKQELDKIQKELQDLGEEVEVVIMPEPASAAAESNQASSQPALKRPLSTRKLPDLPPRKGGVASAPSSTRASPGVQSKALPIARQPDKAEAVVEASAAEENGKADEDQKSENESQVDVQSEAEQAEEAQYESEAEVSENANEEVYEEEVESSAIQHEDAEEAEAEAASDWFICFTEENDEYYYNPSTDETSWEVPEGTHRALMNLWDAQTNPNDMNVDDDDDDDEGEGEAEQESGATEVDSSVVAAVSADAYDEQAVIKCQSYVRRMLAQRKALPQAKKDFNKNRKKILREIVNTESAYVKHLETLVDLYLDNLIEKCDANELGGVTKKDLDDIFPESTREIKNIAEKLLETLNTQLTEAKSVDDLRFGITFCDLAPKLQLYSSYVTDCTESIARWTKLLSNTEFHEVLHELKSKSGSKWDLSMYLIVPVQRVPRYELLLKNLLKATLPSNVDYASIEKAFDLIQKMNEQINKDKKNAEEKRELADVLGRVAKLPDDIASTSTRLVMSGELLSSSVSVEKDKKGHGDRRHANKSHFFLFNNMLVRCKKRIAIGDKQRRYDYKDRIHITSAIELRSFASGESRNTSAIASAAVAAAAAAAAAGSAHAANQHQVEDDDSDDDEATGALSKNSSVNSEAGAAEECGFSLGSKNGQEFRRYWAANETERVAWEKAIRNCINAEATGALSRSSNQDSAASKSENLQESLKAVEARLETCRASLAKAKNKTQRERAVSELQVLEAERATLMIELDSAAPHKRPIARKGSQSGLASAARRLSGAQSGGWRAGRSSGNRMQGAHTVMRGRGIALGRGRGRGRGAPPQTGFSGRGARGRGGPGATPGRIAGRGIVGELESQLAAKKQQPRVPLSSSASAGAAQPQKAPLSNSASSAEPSSSTWQQRTPQTLKRTSRTKKRLSAQVTNSAHLGSRAQLQYQALPPEGVGSTGNEKKELTYQALPPEGLGGSPPKKELQYQALPPEGIGSGASNAGDARQYSSLPDNAFKDDDTLDEPLPSVPQ